MSQPRLNRDILIDVVKELMKNGDQNDIIRFGLSGRQQLEVLYDVFESVTSLELYDDYYAIGWGEKQCFKIYLNAADKIHIHSLMLCIGESVNKLRLDCVKGTSVKYYQPILDKIIQKQKLISLSIPRCYSQNETTKFILKVSKTLKNFGINPFLMTDSIRDCLKLETFTVLNTKDKFFFQFCPKTECLIFDNSDGSPTIKDFHDAFSNFFYEVYLASPFLCSVKEWIFHDKIGKIEEFFDDISVYRNTFSSLEHIKCIMTNDCKKEYDQESGQFYIKRDMRHWREIIEKATNVPAKITYVINMTEVFVYNESLNFCKQVFDGFEVDDTVKEYFCFRQNIESSDLQNVILEVQLFKNK